MIIDQEVIPVKYWALIIFVENCRTISRNQVTSDVTQSRDIGLDLH